MKTIVRFLVASFVAVFLSSVPIFAYSDPPPISTIQPDISPSQIALDASDPPPEDCPAFFTAGEFTIFKCVDKDDDKLIYSNSVGFISQCTDY